MYTCLTCPFGPRLQPGQCHLALTRNTTWSTVYTSICGHLHYRGKLHFNCFLSLLTLFSAWDWGLVSCSCRVYFPWPWMALLLQPFARLLSPMMWWHYAALTASKNTPSDRHGTSGCGIHWSGVDAKEPWSHGRKLFCAATIIRAHKFWKMGGWDHRCRITTLTKILL